MPRRNTRIHPYNSRLSHDDSALFCHICNRRFTSATGLANHESSGLHRGQQLQNSELRALLLSSEQQGSGPSNEGDIDIHHQSEYFDIYTGPSALRNRLTTYIVLSKASSAWEGKLFEYLLAALNIFVSIIEKELTSNRNFKCQIKVIAAYELLFTKPSTTDDVTKELQEVEICLQCEQQIFSKHGTYSVRDMILNVMYPQIISNHETFSTVNSQWLLKRILHSEVILNKFNPFKCGSYLPLPKALENTRSIINVRNTNDNYCFKYAIFSFFHTSDRYKRVNPDFYNSTEFKNILQRKGIEFNFNNISFPTPLSDVCKFERQNDVVSINVFGWDKGKLFPLKNCMIERPYHFDLLYLTSGDEETVNFSDDEDEIVFSTDFNKTNSNIDRVSHYCLITNLEAIVKKQLSRSNDKIKLCKRCLTVFRGVNKEVKLNEHKQYCNKNEIPVARCVYAKPGTCLKFESFEKSFPIDFLVFADFETILKPTNDVGGAPERNLSSIKHVHSHKPVCYSYYVVAPDNDISNIPQLISMVHDNDIFLINDFLHEMYKLGMAVKKKLNRFPFLPYLADYEKEKLFRNSSNCCICNFVFEEEEKTSAYCHIHHCHRTGDIKGIAHIKCNMRTRRVKYLPIYFHNGSHYDFHIILQQAYEKFQYNVIPHTEENYISFSVKIDDNFYLRFIDSYRFLSSSLRSLVDLLNDSQLIHTKKIFGGNSNVIGIVKQKGFFPYEYVKSYDNLKETELPVKDQFYNNMTQEHISDTNYEFCRRVWNTFDCQFLADYMRIYCIIDTVLLADVFSSFRETCITEYKLDPAYYITLPGYGFDVMKKVTGASLQLLTESEANVYNFFEASIRGGITNTNVRYCKANTNRNIELYDNSKEPLSIHYYDFNALYSYSMQQYLPTHNIKELDSSKFNLFTSDYICSIPDDGEIGYYFCVDIEYPIHLHDLHNDLPLFPERKFISLDNSNFQVEKLCCTLQDKDSYHVHYRMLKFALKHGLIIKRIKRIISFNQCPILLPYIEMNTRLRINSKSDFEKSLFKLMNNAVFGKTIENARKRINFELVNTVKRFEKLVNHPNFKSSVYFNENLVGIHKYKTTVQLKLPIYLGATVLDISKLFMYEFWYDKMSIIFSGLERRLLYMDTDSFILSLNVHNVEKNILKYSEYFDCSDYPTSHLLYNSINKKKPGVLKDELKGCIMMEFISLAPKLYAYKCVNDINYQVTEVKKAKGILKTTVAHEITFANYYNVLFENKVFTFKQRTFKSKLHHLRTIEFDKIGLILRKHAKRFFLDNNVESLAFGHYKINNFETVESDENNRLNL